MLLIGNQGLVVVVMDKVLVTREAITALLVGVMAMVIWVMEEEAMVLVERVTIALLEEAITALVGTTVEAAAISEVELPTLVVVQPMVVVLEIMAYQVEVVAVTAFLVSEMVVETTGLGLAIMVTATTLVKLLLEGFLKMVRRKGISRMMRRIARVAMPKEPKQK